MQSNFFYCLQSQQSFGLAHLAKILQVKITKIFQNAENWAITENEYKL